MWLSFTWVDSRRIDVSESRNKKCKRAKSHSNIQLFDCFKKNMNKRSLNIYLSADINKKFTKLGSQGKKRSINQRLWEWKERIDWSVQAARQTMTISENRFRENYERSLSVISTSIGVQHDQLLHKAWRNIYERSTRREGEWSKDMAKEKPSFEVFVDDFSLVSKVSRASQYRNVRLYEDK